jgi:hypothetical protein
MSSTKHPGKHGRSASTPKEGVRGRSKKLIGKLVKGAEAPTQEHRVVVRRYASGSLKEALNAAETLTRNMPVASPRQAPPRGDAQEGNAPDHPLGA